MVGATTSGLVVLLGCTFSGLGCRPEDSCTRLGASTRGYEAVFHLPILASLVSFLVFCAPVSFSTMSQPVCLILPFPGGSLWCSRRTSSRLACTFYKVQPKIMFVRGFLSSVWLASVRRQLIGMILVVLWRGLGRAGFPGPAYFGLAERLRYL